jgi:drug/metabolite transporter (DMT)-like permease
MRVFANLSSGAGLALASALLFGASTPFAKLLLGDGLDPLLLAGILYLGSGAGLGLVLLLRGRLFAASAEAPLRRTDLPWLALVVLFGGIAGPVLMMAGLASVPASAASLLLNLESVSTLAIAWLVLRESVDRRLLLGAGAILAGALILSWGGPASGFGFGFGWGGVLIAAACLAWGIDNNLTRKISAGDAVQIACVKGLVAGTVNLGLALARGSPLPGPGLFLAGGLVGFLGYGVSLILFVRALRLIGTARTGAYYAVAPFFGTLLAIVLLGEPFTMQLAIAGALMGLGIYLHLAEQHEHEHRHEAMLHEHSHVHDEHHRHSHGPLDPANEPHAHAHRHGAMIHSHRHFPDIHHRHPH